MATPLGGSTVVGQHLVHHGLLLLLLLLLRLLHLLLLLTLLCNTSTRLSVKHGRAEAVAAATFLSH